MFKKIKTWWKLHRKNNLYEDNLLATPDSYTREQLANAYKLGYNDGRRDGLAVAREQASKSLKEILWQQNQKRQ